MALSLAMHLSPLGLLLTAVPGVVSDGAGGGDLISTQSVRALNVELVPDWIPSATPPSVPAEAPELANWDSAPEPSPILPEMAMDAPHTQIDRPDPPALVPLPEPDLSPETVLPPPPEPDPPARSDSPPETPKLDMATATAEENSKPKEEDNEAKKKPAANKVKAAPGEASESREAETAAGESKKESAGTGGNAEAATLSQSKVNDLKASWGAKIRARIERRKEYPGKADGSAGKVALSLVIGRDGRLISVSVARSSGHAVLDQAALRAVARAGRFPPAPKGLTDGSYAFALSIGFKK